jgi:hypothetical protein
MGYPNYTPESYRVLTSLRVYPLSKLVVLAMPLHSPFKGKTIGSAFCKNADKGYNLGRSKCGYTVVLKRANQHTDLNFYYIVCTTAVFQLSS